MNKTILIGRLTKDPDCRATADGSSVARYTLAVDRRFKKEGQPGADFISCVVFGKGAEFAAKYLQKGTKIAVTGRIQTGSYTKQDGTRVYTTDVVIEEQEFAESKGAAADPAANPPAEKAPEDFMTLDTGIDAEIPFV